MLTRSEARTIARAVALRAGATYTVLYLAPFPLGFPGTERVVTLVTEAKGALVARVARTFGIRLASETRNTSDSLASYVQVATFVVLASLLAGALTALGRRAGTDERWRAWWRVLLRYFVAASMATYGAVKVLKSQFPALQPSDLQTTYGESSPMGLLWRMMSLSTGYSVFTGLVELTGALLLLFRRTTLLGALVLAAALGNVVALNFCFDVPVKLGSLHLLAFTLCLIAPDARRLAGFFGGRAVGPRDEPPAYQGTRAPVQRVLGVIKWIAALGIVVTVSYEAMHAYRTWGDGAPEEPLVALYEVTEMTVDGAGPNDERWARVTIDRNGFVVFGSLGGRRGLDHVYDATRASLVVTADADRLATVEGTTGPHPDTIDLEGTLGGRRAVIRLRRVPAQEITLISRGFHWVSETSFHR